MQGGPFFLPRFSALCYTFVTSGPKRKAPGLDIRGLFVPGSLAGAGGFEPPATGFGDMCPGKHEGQCASIFSDFQLPGWLHIVAGGCPLSRISVTGFVTSHRSGCPGIQAGRPGQDMAGSRPAFPLGPQMPPAAS